MRNITVILLSLVTASFSINVSASYPEKPNHCPSMGFVRAIGFDVVENQGGNHWIAKKYDTAYDTNAGWEFSLSVNANTQTDAKNNAKAGLQLISELEGPAMTADRKHWICNAKVQKDNDEYVAIAVTPW